MGAGSFTYSYSLMNLSIRPAVSVTLPEIIFSCILFLSAIETGITATLGFATCARSIEGQGDADARAERINAAKIIRMVLVFISVLLFVIQNPVIEMAFAYLLNNFSIIMIMIKVF